MNEVFLVEAKRTPFGNFGGTLKDVPAVELGGMVIQSLFNNVPVEREEIDFVIMGICLPGSGLGPGRQAVIAAGLPVYVNGLTVDRACCSAMTAVGIAFEKIRYGRADIIVAGGMENMSQTPYMIPQLRWGQRIGDFTVEDELVIRNPYLRAPMAQYAGEVALEWGVDRTEQDEWGIRSHLTWVEADAQDKFADELIKVEVKGVKGKTVTFERDEHPRPDVTMEKLGKLKTVYGSPTVTAGNASGICDGATATMIMNQEEVKRRGIKPSQDNSHLPICGEPRQSPVLPGVAIKNILYNNKLSLDDMGLIEINEAFASMPLVSSLYLTDKDREKTHKLRERINVNGGAISIGHPIGATGARILMNLAYEIRRRGLRYGVAAICGAIGHADAIIIENPEY